MTDSEANRFSARAARYAKVGANMGGVAARMAGAKLFGANGDLSNAAALTKALGKDPEVTARVDPSILGGLKVRVGSRLFDASLKSRLDSLKFALKRA